MNKTAMAARRSSDASTTALNAHGARAGHFVTRLQMSFQRFILSPHKKTVEEERVEDMAAVIKTYRGMTDMDEEEEVELCVDGLAFNLVMGFLIMANAVVICIEIDTTDINRPPAVHWLVLEAFFALVFLLEVVLKMCYSGWRWIFLDIWNFICVLIMVLYVIDAAIFAPLEITLCFKSASLLRVLGLVRLRHQIRQLKSLDDLRVIFDSVTVGTKDGNYRKLSGGWDHDEYFGTIPRSMYTLLQIMTLDGWSSSIVRHVINQQQWMMYFFVTFLLVTNYGVVNMVVSMMVQHVCAAAERAEARSQERARRSRQSELQKFVEVFMRADKDDSGSIDYQEFQEAIAKPEVRWRLRALELPLDNAGRLFSVLNGQGFRPLSKEEFIRGCSKLKGPAQSNDLLGVQAQANSLARKLDNLYISIGESEHMLAHLDEVTLRMSTRFEPSIMGCRRKIAHKVGGTKPMVQPQREDPGGDNRSVSLAVGNRPALPLFPDLLF